MTNAERFINAYRYGQQEVSEMPQLRMVTMGVLKYRDYEVSVRFKRADVSDEDEAKMDNISEQGDREIAAIESAEKRAKKVKPGARCPTCSGTGITYSDPDRRQLICGDCQGEGK